MRRASCLLASVVWLTAGLIALNVNAFATGGSLTRQEPQVTGARLRGKKLIVVGENFSEGAVILIDGAPVNTVGEPDNPTRMLIAKKAGKRMPADKLVAITVQNDGGIMSPVFDFFSGLTITLDDAGKTINLKAGDKFQLFLKRDGFEWTVNALDSLLTKLIAEPSVPGAQGIFQAVRAGNTKLTAIGDLPCRKSTPPCLVPSLGFEVTLVIE